jgi:uncharacterized metal-binding protein
MPSGRIHDRITLWTLPCLVGLAYSFTRQGELTLLFSGGFLFSGLMFGPDLDIYSRQFQRWGPLRVIWLPYQKLLCHRSFFSHGLIVGTLIRVIYLGTILLLIAIPLVAISQLLLGFAWNWHTVFYTFLTKLKSDYLHEAGALWLGLELGSMSHSLSDWLASAYKRSRSAKKKTNRKKRQSTRK